MNVVFETATHAETVRLGRLLAAMLQPGMTVALVGDLGAGKTTLAKGMVSELLDINEHEVTSPTFTIVQEYSGPVRLFHVDAYRLNSVCDLDAVGFEDCIDGSSVTVIEWADRIREALPGETLLIVIEQTGEQSRRISLQAATPQQADGLKRVTGQMRAGTAVSGEKGIQ